MRTLCVHLFRCYVHCLETRYGVKKAVYIVVGIREDGSKEVLGYTIAPNESAFVWKELLEDIKSRGAERRFCCLSPAG